MRTLLNSFLKLLLVGIVLTNYACTNYAEPFVEPDKRDKRANELSWKENSFLVLGWHDVEDDDPSQIFLSVSSAHLQQQFSWLKTAGYNPVSIDQILAAKNQGVPLPPKAVLLTFDDGYASFYERVYPLLLAYQWPAVMSPVSSWVDTPAGGIVDFGGINVPREHFLNWEQIAEMSASGLVEIGAHTHDLHFGHLANPQGNTQPAAASKRYDPVTQQYESDEHFRARVAADIKKVTDSITRATGKAPRVWVWPYGRVSGITLDEVKKAGYQMAMTLEDGAGNVDTLFDTPRLLIDKDPTTKDFAWYLVSMELPPTQRLVHVDLDYVYDPDPVQMERNLDQLIQRIADLKVNLVALQAFADPEGDGLVKSVYFPNTVLPMRADLFNRVAWQLRSRIDVPVYAWMPVLSFDLAPEITRVQELNPSTGEISINTEQYRRISPFDPEGRRQIKQLYADLAKHSMFNGLLFHDDAILSDLEDYSPYALVSYKTEGLVIDPQSLHNDPTTQTQWTRYKTQVLNDFTLELADVVKAISGPQIKTARNIFALPIIEPSSESWFAQNLDDFLRIYDYTFPMIMPRMESVALKEEDNWIRQIVAEVASREKGLQKTIFELQTKDWRQSPARPIDTKKIVHWIKILQSAGAKHFGYYPDDFLLNQPNLEQIRPAISNEWFIFKK